MQRETQKVSPFQKKKIHGCVQSTHHRHTVDCSEWLEQRPYVVFCSFQWQVRNTDCRAFLQAGGLGGACIASGCRWDIFSGSACWHLLLGLGFHFPSRSLAHWKCRDVVRLEQLLLEQIGRATV